MVTGAYVLRTIGKTPIVKIGNVYAKLEALNPSGSIKDRIALAMVRAAESQGKLRKGYTIIEPTSGNTGIALAMVAAIKGYKMIAVMPENASKERIQMIKAFGGDVVLTPAHEKLPGAIKKAEELSKKPRTYMPQQFRNRNNIKAQEETGMEILKQVGKVDVFVSGIGTGGTLMGISKVLRKANPKLKVVAVMPKEKDHKIEGIGDGIMPDLVDVSKISEFVKVSSKSAINMSRKMAKDYGLMVGISSGANLVVALRFAKRYKKVVTVLPDRGERYLSKELYKSAKTHKLNK